MIKVYAFSTPNSVRGPIGLEELGLDYELEPVNVRKGEQKLSAYPALNPNGKVPASSRASILTTHRTWLAGTT
jgi:GST-like protein